MSYYATEVFPLEVGTKWLYKLSVKFFSTDIKLEVMDKIKNMYLLKYTSGKLEGSFIMKADVDLSIVGYSKKAVDTLKDNMVFETVPKAEILKSPVVAGAEWQNHFGRFTIVSTDYKFKSGETFFPDCIYLKLRDTSNTNNDFYIKEGVGILYASINVDTIGSVNLVLKKFN